MPLEPIGRMVLDRNPDNFFAETEQVGLPSRPHRARHRLHRRSAAAGPAVLLHRHAAHPPRRRRTSTRSRSTGRSARCTTSSATASADGRRRRAGSNYEPNSLAPDGAARGPGRAASRRSRGSTPATKVRQRVGDVRRSLQPGALFLRSMTEPEQRHIVSAFTFELSKVATPAIRTPDAGPPRQHRRASWASGSRTGSAWRGRPSRSRRHARRST